MQSDRGAAIYRDKCMACHGASLAGGDHGPPLNDEAFWEEWDGKPARLLYSRIISTMPPDDPGSLPSRDVIDIVGHLLVLNGVSPGTKSIENAGDLDGIQLEKPRQAGR